MNSTLQREKEAAKTDFEYFEEKDNKEIYHNYYLGKYRGLEIAVNVFNELKIFITPNSENNNRNENLIQELKNLYNALIRTSEYNKKDEKDTDVQYWKGDCNGRASAYKITAEQLKKIIDEYE